jgi:site-specific recombinase XerD
MVDEEYEAYERECERIRKDNAVCLGIFRKSLEKAGLSRKTIEGHVGNVDLFINEFLLRYDPNPMEKGTGLISSFLGDYFIRKCMWSTPSSIRQNIASLKKFYKCMLSEGKIDAEDYDYLLETIKEEKDDWIEECEEFNGGSDDWEW